MTEDLNTEQTILKAAREVFLAKGMAGSRMQEIADKAGINKAMLHYYFRSKEKLFEAIFQQALESFFPKINELFASSEIPLFDKIRLFVSTYMDLLCRNPYLPAFVIHEVNRDPQWFVKFIQSQVIKPNPGILMGQISADARAGKIIPIQPLQLLVNMFSLCIFPFLARPMIMGMFGLNDLFYNEFIESRKSGTADFIINGITPK